MATDKKSSTGEKVDRLITYGLLAKEAISAFSSLIKNPAIQTKIIEELIKVAKDGRTRADELFFFTSLINLENVSAENKKLFLKKHYELVSPDLSGKTKKEVAELKRKEELASGLVFLIAEDKTINNENPQKRFQYAKDIWYGIFWEINKERDDIKKLALLEERILHFGKNSQEKNKGLKIASKAWGA
ncbi:MAG: hypothetical protein WA019_05470, partial [Candidatus Moraniibacteriota bacterium]